MKESNWKDKYADFICSASEATHLVKPGNSIFIGTGCGQPQHLVNVLVDQAKHVTDAHIIHLLTMGSAPYAQEKFRERFNMNSFFIADNVRDALEKGIRDYTPIFLSEIPHEFETGRIPLDVALISVTPPDEKGLCSLGVSVDIVKSAASNAKYVIANIARKLGTDRIIVHFVNYSDTKENIKVKLNLKGFTRAINMESITVLSPDSVPQKLKDVTVNGFSLEFTIPKLEIYDVVTIN